MPNFNIPIDELRKRKIFLATPMYGGQCTGTFCRSIADFSAFAAAHGLDFALHFLYNESLIPRARNYCADAFMRARTNTKTDEKGNVIGGNEPFTHFVFIDADIQFRPEDIVTMVWLQSDDSPYDIIAGPYPKKSISWEKIKQAVNKGVADEDPNVLEHFVGDFVFNLPPGTREFRLDEPAEVLETGTGFMSIRRQTFEKWNEKYPEYWYKPDHVRSEEFDGKREIMLYFHSEIDPDSRRYLSEDYWFCQKCRKIDLKTWICPWFELQHFGSYNFGGKLGAMAQIGASPTASEEILDSIKANRKKAAAQPTGAIERTIPTPGGAPPLKKKKAKK